MITYEIIDLLHFSWRSFFAAAAAADRLRVFESLMVLLFVVV